MLAKINEYWHESGHLNEAQRDFMIALLSEYKPKYCLETGFATGRSTITTLTAAEPDLMVSIDINLDYLGAREHAEKFRRDYISLKLIEGDSKKILTKKFFKENFPKGLDFAFLDGDHSLKGLLNDLRWAWEYLNKGGHILIDDYKSGEPDGIEITEVNQAVDAFCLKMGITNKFEWSKNGKGMVLLTKN